VEFSSFLFAYVGPDQLLPVASGLAGVLGVLLLWGRTARGWVVRSFRAIVRK
jgi:hypothetical protein